MQQATSGMLGRRLVPLAVLGAVLCAAGCGSGGTTTVIQKTVAEGKPELADTFLKAVAFEHLFVEPKSYPFVADGSLIGIELSWEGWGTATATGRGKIEERDFSSGDPNDRKTYPGAVIASGLEECRGKNYYTEVVAEVPPNAIYVPAEASQLSTPCRSYQSIEAEQQESDEAQQADHILFFYTPSHNIACAMTKHYVRCDIREKSWEPPPKPASCEFDWGNGVVLPARGHPEFTCASDSTFGGPENELPYGHLVERGGMSCLSQRSGLVCGNAAEHGFKLAAQSVRSF